MRKMHRAIVGTALAGLLGLLALGGPAAQDREAEPPRAKGLIPLDARQVEEIIATWPRVARVGINRLGYERVNEVRAAKGKPPLDARLVEPVGGELESARAVPGATVLSVTPNEALAGDLPASVDNSLLRYFPPIRSQGRLGACASFASTYVQLSYMTAFQRNLDIRNPTDNTNKYSPKWTYTMVNDGEDAGSNFSENYQILEKHGAATWEEFPYDANFLAWCLDGAVWRNALGVRAKSVQYVRDTNTDAGIAQLKELLVDGYIVVFGTYIDSWAFTTVKDDASTGDDAPAVGKSVAYWLDGTEGAHAMTVVGYNDAVWTDINANDVIDPGEKGAFRIANSWGSGWYEAGFTWLAYDALKDPSPVPGAPSAGRVSAFQADMVFVLTARTSYEPLMIGEFTVGHAKRNQLRLSLGRSGTTAAVPAVTWAPAAFQNQGGAFAFDGSTTAVDGTFVLDFTDILAAGAGPQRYYLGVNDSTALDEAALSAFKIVDLTTSPATEVPSSHVPQTVDARQAYAYVDYAYLGPAYNDPPQLFSPQVSPETGRAGDTFTFNVRYTDSDGDAPAVKTVVLDGATYAMSLVSGQPPASGWYTYSASLPAGEHAFYFYFEDGRGEAARAPVAGTFASPAVYGHMMTALAPASAETGDPGFTLTVTGSFFESGAVVTWDGADRTTTFVSGSRVDATIGAADLAVGKTVPVVVRNPGGLLSNALQFTVNNPVPALASVSPGTVPGGGTSFTLVLAGTGFVSNSVARWNGADLATTYFSPTEIRASLTVLELDAAGEFEVSVRNPAPAGGTSEDILIPVSSFTVDASGGDLATDAGHSVSRDVVVTPDGGPFDAAVAFMCTGLPRGCTASFSPATVTPGSSAATTTLTLATKARQSTAAAAVTGTGGLIPPAALGLILFAAALASRAFSRRTALRCPARRRLAAAALALLLIGTVGCSTGGGGDAQDTGTPAGTYQIGIEAKSGSLSATTSVNLIVR